MNTQEEFTLFPDAVLQSPPAKVVRENRRCLSMNERLRRITPWEMWRLMGFTDDDYHKARKVCSETQLKKQAGNSIVVPVLEAIFKQMS